MKIIPPDGVQAAAKARGYSVDSQDELNDWPLAVYFDFSQDTYDQSGFPLARFMASLAIQAGECFGVVDRLMVWRSGRDEYLIDLALQDFFGGSSGEFVDGAGFIATKSDCDALVSLVHLAMIFGWEMYLRPMSNSEQIFLSHDSFFQIHSKDISKDIASMFKSQTGREPS